MKIIKSFILNLGTVAEHTKWSFALIVEKKESLMKNNFLNIIRFSPGSTAIIAFMPVVFVISFWNMPIAHLIGVSFATVALMYCK